MTDSIEYIPARRTEDNAYSFSIPTNLLHFLLPAELVEVLPEIWINSFTLKKNFSNKASLLSTDQEDFMANLGSWIKAIKNNVMVKITIEKVEESWISVLSVEECPITLDD